MADDFIGQGRCRQRGSSPTWAPLCVALLSCSCTDTRPPAPDAAIPSGARATPTAQATPATAASASASSTPPAPAASGPSWQVQPRRAGLDELWVDDAKLAVEEAGYGGSTESMVNAEFLLTAAGKDGAKVSVGYHKNPASASAAPKNYQAPAGAALTSTDNHFLWVIVGPKGKPDAQASSTLLQNIVAAAGRKAHNPAYLSLPAPGKDLLALADETKLKVLVPTLGYKVYASQQLGGPPSADSGGQARAIGHKGVGGIVVDVECKAPNAAPFDPKVRDTFLGAGAAAYIHDRCRVYIQVRSKIRQHPDDTESAISMEESKAALLELLGAR